MTTEQIEERMRRHQEIMAMEVSTNEGKSISEMRRWCGPNGEVVYLFGDGTRSKVVKVEATNWPYELSEK